MLKGPYRKYVYWLTGEWSEALKARLAAGNVKIKTAKGIVCTPLDIINKISIVPPGVWNESCGRQGSWYRTSDKNGLYLVVSSFELDGPYREFRAAVITESDFSPPRWATPEEKAALVEDPALLQRMPVEWTHVAEVEKRIYLRWARRLGSSVEDYETLYRSHTANHANFIHPHFFVEQDGRQIPYSIDRSAHLCSCCVELFQVLGAGFEKKLVVPCPGATIYARLKPDRYLLVER